MTLDLFSLDAGSIPVDQIPAAMAALAALQTQLCARLMTPGQEPQPGPAAEPDVMLKVDEVAARVRKSTKWVYRRAKTLPFARRLGPRSWVFSEHGLEKWLARQKA